MSYITIYIENKPIFLCDEIGPKINGYIHRPDVHFTNEIGDNAIATFIKKINEPTMQAGIIFNKDFHLLKNTFFNHFTVIKAGGGVVKNENNDVLFIFRHGKWDLPKGKLEENETIEQCALREVEEETGLHKIELSNFIKTTYHTYKQSGKHIIKESHWYAMKSFEDEKLIPQTEEGITKICWVKQEDIHTCFSNTFPAIIDVLSGGMSDEL